MKHSKGLRWTTVIGVGALLISTVPVFALMPHHGVPSETFAAKEAQLTTGDVAGEYTGMVTLESVVHGEGNTATSTPLPKLGMIDLALHLEQTGTTVNGYIVLDDTLVFPAVDIIMVTPPEAPPGAGTPVPQAEPLDIGPRVHGTLDSTGLHLESDSFVVELSPERTLSDGRKVPAQRVTRQLRLDSVELENKGEQLKGQYRETMWDFAPQPITAVGTFNLRRPVFDEATPNDDIHVYLPLTRRD